MWVSHTFWTVDRKPSDAWVGMHVLGPKRCISVASGHASHPRECLETELLLRRQQAIEIGYILLERPAGNWKKKSHTQKNQEWDLGLPCGWQSLSSGGWGNPCGCACFRLWDLSLKAYPHLLKVGQTLTEEAVPGPMGSTSPVLILGYKSSQVRSKQCIRLVGSWGKQTNKQNEDAFGFCASLGGLIQNCCNPALVGSWQWRKPCLLNKSEQAVSR